MLEETHEGRVKQADLLRVILPFNDPVQKILSKITDFCKKSKINK